MSRPCVMLFSFPTLEIKQYHYLDSVTSVYHAYVRLGFGYNRLYIETPITIILQISNVVKNSILKPVNILVSFRIVLTIMLPMKALIRTLHIHYKYHFPPYKFSFFMATLEPTHFHNKSCSEQGTEKRKQVCKDWSSVIVPRVHLLRLQPGILTLLTSVY